jgi:hypothetical protein
MKPILVITHARFDTHRRAALRNLVDQLRIEAPKLPFIVIGDDDRKGSLWCWKTAMEKGLSTDATHIVQLPDDAGVCRDFGLLIEAAIKARPDDVFDCIVNHPHAHRLQTLWYSTFDGYLGHGGVFPRALLEECLRWREDNRVPDTYPNDAGVNLWAMDTGRLIYKTGFSLVRHDLRIPSLDSHDNQPIEMRMEQRFIDDYRRGIPDDPPQLLLRTFGVPESIEPGAQTACTPLGRTYESNHLALLEVLKPTSTRVQRYLDVERDHGVDHSRLSLFIAAPAYRGEIKSDWMLAVIAEIEILRSKQVSTTIEFKADSLINRARNRLVTKFLLSDCSHMLMWDTDNFPTVPGFCAELLASGHDVVGGAVVLKDGKGDKFALRFGQTGPAELKVENGCIPVEMLGTGFLMVSRKAILKMIARYPETYYRAGRWMEKAGRAEWHLFADAVVNQDHLSEDFEFCRRWKAIGGSIWLRPDMDFIHYGEYPFQGSFMKTFVKKEEGDAARARQES